jgi:Cu/Zn superoxide dismutase
MLKTMISGLAFAAISTAFVAAPAAQAKVTTYNLMMSGKQETPPNTTAGSGHGTVTFDDATKQITYNITYSGLTGDATAAHFHGPAAPGTAAGVLVPIKGPLASPITGTATLTDDQVKALTTGMVYFNVHTKANPAGEIRGQLVESGPKQ